MADTINLKKAKEVFDSLCEMLDGKDGHYEKHEDDLVVTFIVGGEDIPMRFIMNVDAKRELVRLISPIPVIFDDDKRVEGAIATCQANYRLADGSFDYDFREGKYSISGSRRYSGLFSWVGSSGIVKNLGVNANIKVEFKPTNSIYYAFAGGIAAINDGTISNCWCSGQIYLKNSTSVGFSGGIAGGSGTENSHTGEIKTCYNIANIETVADDAYAGGILGTAENNSHIVSYCYNRGTVKATGANSNNTAVGGIISHGRTYAKNCFNAGAILTDYSDKQTLGGIIGFTRNTSSHGNFPTDCVWLKANNCQAKWGIGIYPNDKSGGNNTGVTAVSKENEKALEILNGNTNNFILLNGKIQLTWE